MGGGSTDFSSSRSYDFADVPAVTKKSAASYAREDRREYTPTSKGLPALGRNMSTKNPLTLTILLDLTGSMQQIPAKFVEKISTLYSETNAAMQGKDLKTLASGEKLEDLLDIGIVTIGDAAFSGGYADKYPVQVVDFCHGPALTKAVNDIYSQGGGGSNTMESYDLGAYFLLNHCDVPNAPNGAKPLLILAGDEGFYETVRASWVKQFIGDDLPKDLKTADVLSALGKKFEVNVLRPELSYSRSEYDLIQKQWQGVFNPQVVMPMDGYDRLVDCIIGCAGYASNNFNVSEDLLRRRQKPAQVDEVLKTLHPLLSSPRPNPDPKPLQVPDKVVKAKSPRKSRKK